MSVNKLTICVNDSIIHAMKKIEDNKKGFLVVIDDLNVVKGTITDGDIRRFLIKSNSLNGIVNDAMKTDSICVCIDKGVSVIADLFKNEGITFLPIIDSEKHLINVITKRQFHSIFMQNISFSLDYPFEEVDEELVDYEIYQRPWGYYKTTVYNEFFQSKVICVYPNQRLSLQSHNHREEHWIIVHGRGMAIIEGSKKQLMCGDSIFIPKGTKHRLINLDDKENLIVSEVQLGDYLGEDDIVRYQDDYGRA